jgi:hypothetical protein
MSRLPSAVILAAALAVAAGFIAETARAASAALPTSGPVTKAEATAYAHAVNLTPADVPGMINVSQEGEEREKTTHPVESRCRLRESHVHVADVHSPTFRSGEGLQLELAVSDVEVVPTVALADGKLTQVEADLRSRRARACLKRTYAAIFGRSLAKGVAGRAGLTVGRATLTVLHPSVPRSFGLRVVVPFTITGTLRSISASVEVDAYGFVAGRTAVSLLRLSFSGPVSADTHLLSLLYERATA